jgi:hypothetical protein
MTTPAGRRRTTSLRASADRSHHSPIRRRAWMLAAAVIVALVIVGVVAAGHQTPSKSANASPAPPIATTGSVPEPVTATTAPATTADSTAFPTEALPTNPTATTPANATVTTAPPTTPPAPTTVSGLISVAGDARTVLNTDLLVGPCTVRLAADGEALPDPRCTPGVVSERVSQANIATTICVSGYTTSVRPAASITTPLKRRTAAVYGLVYEPQVQEYDHLIPLELGGANDVRNLWTEPPTSAGQTTTLNGKDQVENRLKDAVCAGRISLTDAQRRIATDWTTATAGL